MNNKQVAVIGLIGESIFMEVDQFPKAGETVKAKSVFTEVGGKGFNQALAAKRLNATVNFHSVIGNDENGKRARNVLRQAGIHDVLLEKDQQTALACILTDKVGNNQVIVANEVINDFNESDLSLFEKEIRNSKVLLLQAEIPHNVNIKAIKIANDEGILIIYNPAPARKADLAICKDVYLFTPNELEAEMLFGVNWDDTILNFCTKNKTNIIVTTGDKGVILYTEGKRKAFPAIKVEAVDTTGAGDAFHGALAAFLAANQSLEASIKMAIIVAGLSVQNKGIINSYPNYNEVLQYINNNKE